jgi:hypothetical protein
MQRKAKGTRVDNDSRSTRGSDESDKKQTRGIATASQHGNLLQLLIGASAVIGGITYAILRIALNHFYSAFGVTPEEVGWNVSVGLTRFGPTLLLIIFGATFIVVRFQEDRLMRSGSLYAFFTTGRSPFIFVAVLVFFCGFLVWLAHQNVDNLRRGVPPGAPISAPCVNIPWFDVPDARVLASTFSSERKLFLLGEAGGTTVLYDAATNATLRMPTSRLVLRSCPK